MTVNLYVVKVTTRALNTNTISSKQKKKQKCSENEENALHIIIIIMCTQTNAHMQTNKIQKTQRTPKRLFYSMFMLPTLIH